MAEITVQLEGKTSAELLNEGVRALAQGEFTAAVQCLSRASELAVTEHGEKHDSLGEIYYYYGKSLLELSREEGDLLGEAVPKDVVVGKAEDGENDDELAQEEGDEPMVVEGDDEEGEEEVEEEEEAEDGEAVEGTSKGIEFNGQTEGDAPGNKENEGKEKSEIGEGDAGEDEPTDLQVAWEILELAKMIFEERGDPGKEDLANTLILLGEVSLESENFESAVNDIRHGLEIQKSLYKGNDRKLAGSYYKLGVAQSTNSQIEDAVESFNKSIELLRNKIKELECSESDEDRREVADMRQLIPEIEEKVSDMKNYKEEAIKNAEQPQTATSPEKKAQDISHLVKRKRASLDDGEGASSPAKKTALLS